MQRVAHLLSSAAFRRGRMMIAPPSAQAPCWRIFAGGLRAEVLENQELGICTCSLKGPDGKILRQGIAWDLTSAFRQAFDLLWQLSGPGHRSAA